jgi:hypothetical protein
VQAAKRIAQRLNRATPAILQLEQTAQVEIDLATAGQSAEKSLAASASLIPVEIDHDFAETLGFFLQ